MAREKTDLSAMLDEFDWVGPADEYWPWSADTKVALRDLAADDPQTITRGLSHLWVAFIEYPNVFPPTAAAVHYVLALLDLRPGGDTAIRNPDGQFRPLRAHLLSWLAGAADAVGDVRVREFVELAGFSPLEYPYPAWHEVRKLRPRMYCTVAAFLDDPHPAVRKEAIAAAALLADVAGTEPSH
ncbi:hypothetical protein ACQP2X_21805 [Actinoplanes sp. CA-131856]